MSTQSNNNLAAVVPSEPPNQPDNDDRNSSRSSSGRSLGSRNNSHNKNFSEGRSGRHSLRKTDHTGFQRRDNDVDLTKTSLMLSQAGGSEKKAMETKRRRSYDSTLFGLDVFEGLQSDYLAKREKEEREHWVFKYIPVIDPQWKFQRYRDLASVFIILYSVYVSLFEYVFTSSGDLGAEIPTVRYLGLFCTIYFWIDLGLCFTTAIYDTEDDLVTNRKTIAITYLKGWFWIDLLSNLEVNGALALLKILRLARFPRMFIRWMNLGVSTMALNIFKIMIITLTSGHFFACLFFAVAAFEGHQEDSWTRKDFGDYTLYQEQAVTCDDSAATGSCYEVVATASLGSMYISSLYFSYATLTTVGFGDINATTTYERGVALIALSIGSAIFAGIVGTMSTLVDTMDELEEMKLNKLKHIQQFIKSHHFPEKIRARIKKYYELHFNYLKRELHMLDELSPALRHECMHHIYFKILSKVPFLRDSPQIVQSAVIANVKPVLCCAKDYLVIEGQVLHHIFLVASGAVEVINNKGLVSRTYGVGSFFGEKCAFHSHYLSTVSYRAKVDLEVLTIDRNAFVDLLNTYDAFAETFVMICQKREDHKKGLVAGQSKKTDKLQRQAEAQVRPVTPPPGTTWKDTSTGERTVLEGVSKTVPIEAAVDETKDTDFGTQRQHMYGEIFDDESVPALLDKLQFNLGSQLDDIQDCLEHLEERIDDLEELERGRGESPTSPPAISPLKAHILSGNSGSHSRRPTRKRQRIDENAHSRKLKI
ncbi:hypothetical protein TrVE_jg12093 [Triparma verrucosa]|uniref:Cyclic nucleotide-binding domain-containing protein n=1 Tax=Triparma verrucosa TaxID=1606542 RepID=A0A9W7KX84_9STRA|nr:hypothetical protein TrVE_jg12093 [Triparma verrucosa]